MEKRRLGRTGIEVGIIGIGVEHLAVSEENMSSTFREARRAGANYVDLVFNDPIDAHSEHWKAIGPAIRAHRDSLVLCLHWGFVHHEPIEDCQRKFEAALEEVGNGYAEVAMMTMVDSERTWNEWARPAIERIQPYQRKRRIGFVGLSSHNATVARAAVESGSIDVLMFPINLYQHAREGARAALLATCRERAVGVVAMKPYYGGRLISIHGRRTEITATECLHYVLSEDVATVVPGVQDAQHMIEAVEAVAVPLGTGRAVSVGDDLASTLRGQCVMCQHCMPCPVEINIPGVIQNVDYLDYYSGTAWSRAYNTSLYQLRPVKASACTECGICMDRCPFGVNVIDKMRRASEVFEK